MNRKALILTLLRTTPVWLFATRWTAITFSSAFKNQAFAGVSGSKARVTMPMATVTTP